MKKTVTFLLAFICCSFFANVSIAQCGATITVTPTSNPGEIIIDYDLTGYATPSTFSSYVDFYDGSLNYESTAYANAASLPVTHTLNTNGTYQFISYIDSSGSCTDTLMGTVTISNINTPNCNASISLYQDSTNIALYYGYNNSTGTNLTYSWDFGDGTTYNTQYPSHTYSSVGTFNVCLIISDGMGCTDTACQSITVVIKAGTTVNIIDPGTANSIELEKISEINVFPNPSKGEYNIQFNSNEVKSSRLAVTDLQGRIIYSELENINEGMNLLTLDLVGTDAGIYLLSLDNHLLEKIIIE